ncbi:MAG TPA: hypothetical protein PKN54_00820 [Candidatus Cloacimonas acidaminovorans]|nr:hypothetical protein [Candidatus Cloacimonas acidaminovorans]
MLAAETAFRTSFFTHFAGSIIQLANQSQYSEVRTLKHFLLFDFSISFSIPDGFNHALIIICLNGDFIDSLTISYHILSSLDIFFTLSFIMSDIFSRDVHAHKTTHSSIADLTAFIASSTLYFISVCSVSEFVKIFMLAIFHVNLPSLCFNFSILNVSFSDSNNAFTSSCLSLTSQFAHTKIVSSFDATTVSHVQKCSILAILSFTGQSSHTTVAHVFFAKSYNRSLW